MSEWQPIETAPKDVAVFIGKHTKKGWLRTIGLYDHECPHLWDAQLENGDYAFSFANPTHWQPLPKPPTE